MKRKQFIQTILATATVPLEKEPAIKEIAQKFADCDMNLVSPPLKLE